MTIPPRSIPRLASNLSFAVAGCTYTNRSRPLLYNGGHASLTDLAARLDPDAGDPAQQAHEELADDRLRLIFTCCHPALAPDARVALTLREVYGLTTEAIAHPETSTRRSEWRRRCHRCKVGPSR